LSNLEKRSRVLDRLAYQYIGPLFEARLDKFEDLKRKLRKAGIDISLRMYLSTWVFNAILVGIATIFLTFPFILFIGVPFIFLLLFPIFTALLTWAYALLNPGMKVGERKRKLESSLPTAASYMTAMASAGVTPDKIFLSLARDDIDLYIKHDAKKISRDIEIFNLDIIRALEAASRRSPSYKYSSFLEGIVSTFTSGGDLQMFFQNSSEGLMRDKVSQEKAFIESLGLMAELYLVACIVLPTFIVVMIALIALQGTMGHDGMTTIVFVLAFVLIPILQSMIMIMVDGLQPEA
jgi:archaeal flagellar protein FlaJ